MTDAPLIEKKLALIETCVGDLRRLARPALLATDVREERFAEHTLQMAIQAALDIVRDVLEHRLDDLLAFVRAIRARLSA